VRACAAAALLAASVAVAAAPNEKFAVGVLRRDGIVIPFAAFDGKRWSSPWPIPDREVMVPINVASVPSRWWGPTPPLEEWQTSTDAGGSTVRVVQPDWVDVHCDRQIGLKTTYRSAQPPPPRTVQPYPKDGVASAPPHAIERIQILPSYGPEMRALLQTIYASFNAAERLTEERYGHPITRRAREGVDPTIEAVYGYGTGPRYFYVEATRPYRRLGQSADDCVAVAVGTGWFVLGASGLRPLTMAVDMLNCARSTASYMLPLGVVRANDRLYWLAQFSGFDHERYVVLELKPKAVEVVINRWGGTC